jgi:UDP-N-acetylmuramoyl-L-alanyl-D-glutamate--2,6-diaminopimelate ligase
VSNALVAAGIAYAESIDLEVIQQGLSRPVHIPGRFEAVPNTHGFSVVVDYAHTPDAFQNILTLARHLKPGRIITLFGCGGDRDRTKRPEMAAIAETYSDFVVVTSDNPRHEDPARILNDIQAGFKGTAYHMIDDRKTAIQAAISEARPGDLVLLLGKGHEETQTIGEKAIPFSDKAVALDALQQLA